MLSSTDEQGKLRDVRCHDGLLVAVELLGGDAVKLGIRRVGRTLVQIDLDGVRYFTMNNFREGNIIDSVYLWSAIEAPRNQLENALRALSLYERDLFRKNDLLADKLSVIESSYGATIHALVSRVDFTDH